MRQHILLASLSLTLVSAPTVARSDNLLLPPGQFWVGVASSQDLDAAVGIARLYSNQHSRVVLASNGWYAVILGPVIGQTLAEFRAKFQGWPALPSDALFSRGAAYMSVAWQPPPSPIQAQGEYNTDEPATLASGAFTVKVSKTKTGDDEASVGIEGAASGTRLFDLNGAPSFTSDFGSDAYIVRLDPNTHYSQVVATQFSGGAHCCTSTFVATELAGGRWTIVQGADLDGDGYEFEDIDEDGAAELVAPDNTFLYAFESYAGSFAPEKIYRLASDHLEDVTAEPRFHHRLLQDLAGLEFLARGDPRLWRSNGFLAAWVASKARLGQLADAWDRMIPLYDHQSDFGEMVCRTGGPISKCASADTRTLPFPLSLARHLAHNGYGPLPPYLAEVDPNLLSANFELPAPAPKVPLAPPMPAKPPANETSSGGQEGSGFFVAANAIMTNAHVVEGCSDVSLSVGGIVSRGAVIARDAINDLAAIRSFTTAPAIAKLRTGSRLGEDVSAFGFPLNGLLATGGNFTRGNITATAGLSDDSRFFQISDPVQPGNSGGPLLDESGNVVGVVTAKLNALKLAAMTDDVAQNINFAIKASAVQNFLEANSIPFQSGSVGNALASPDIAALAQSFSTIVVCKP